MFTPISLTILDTVTSGRTSSCVPVLLIVVVLAVLPFITTLGCVPVLLIATLLLG